MQVLCLTELSLLTNRPHPRIARSRRGQQAQPAGKESLQETLHTLTQRAQQQTSARFNFRMLTSTAVRGWVWWASGLLWADGAPSSMWLECDPQMVPCLPPTAARAAPNTCSSCCLTSLRRWHDSCLQGLWLKGHQLNAAEKQLGEADASDEARRSELEEERDSAEVGGEG